MRDATRIPVGISGLPPTLGLMMGGGFYAAGTATRELAMDLLAGTVTRAVQQKCKACAVTADIPGLLAALQQREVDTVRMQARGLLSLFQSRPEWPARIARAGFLQLLDEFDHFDLDEAGVLLIDAADGLFSWNQHSALAREGQQLRLWCQSSGRTVLMLFSDGQDPFSRAHQLQQACRALNGVADLRQSGRELLWLVNRWQLGDESGGGAEEPLRRTESGELVAICSDEATQRRNRAWLQNATDQDEVFVSGGAVAPLPIGWKPILDNAALLVATEASIGASCILDAGPPQEFRQLVHAVHQLRKCRGHALKILVQQGRAPLRPGQSVILLSAGANLVLDPGTTAAAVAQSVEQLRGHVLTSAVPDQLEQVLASGAAPGRSGYLGPQAFCTEVVAATEQAHAAGIECILMRMVLLPERDPLDALRLCRPLRDGDMFTADHSGLYLFLFACWETDADGAMERVFKAPIEQWFVGHVRMPGRSAIMAEIGDLQYRAESNALPDHRAMLDRNPTPLTAIPMPSFPAPGVSTPRVNLPTGGTSRSAISAPLHLRNEAPA